MRRLSLRAKIIIWFGIIILISLILYGSMVYMVYQFNLQGERYFDNLKGHPEIDQSFVEDLEQADRGEPKGIPPGITVLPPEVFMRIFLSITGGVIAIILLSATGGFLILRRMLVQVDHITRNVKEIDDRGLHLRLNLEGNDPISNMANTFDSMLDKIERAFASQRQFVQNASHELNTPLTVIKTKIDVLKQKKSVPVKKYRETIDLVDKEIVRLSKITDELLQLSSLDEGKNVISKEAVSLGNVLENILKLYDNRIKSRKLSVDKSITGDTEIIANKLQMEQLIFNLLDNAIKYSESGGSLKIRLRGRKDHLALAFANKTSSVSEKDIPHIFERFYRSETDTKSSFGLGLSIASKIAENHGAKLKARFSSIKSEIVFTAKFPRDS